MRILFDHGTPVPLRRALSGHEVVTAYELGWAELANGALLNAAEAEFDALITADQSLVTNRISWAEIWRSWSFPRTAGHGFKLILRRL